MTRLYLISGGALAVIVMIVAIYLAGRNDGGTTAERDALQSDIETRERVGDAMDRPDGCAWLSACVAPASTSGLCAGLERPVAALRGALTAYERQTPDAMGEAGTDVVLGFEAGCMVRRDFVRGHPAPVVSQVAMRPVFLAVFTAMALATLVLLRSFSASDLRPRG